MSSTTPPFSLTKSKYDQSTYVGRYMGFIDVVDPRTLFTSQDALQQSLDLLDQYEKGTIPPSVTDEQLWEAKKIRDAIIHPGTGEPINPLLRMSGFVPANVPIIAGMLSTTSLGGTLFWQWANQSYNSAMNYANRAGSSMSDQQIATSYGIAVGLSCGLASAFRYLGMHGPQVFRRAAANPFIVPYVAVASAGAANVYFTRRPEITNGVVVMDKQGNELGVSKEAGKQGVLKTIMSRSVFLPMPILLGPHLLMKAVPKSLNPRARMVCELLSITLCLSVALPGAIAMFPQTLELEATSLEPEFQGLVAKDGSPITKLYSNKGL